MISLIGPMGCGKSTIGRNLSKHLDYRFIDLDAYIEQETQTTISNLFKDIGTVAFRTLEYTCLKACLQHPNTVLSLGGGTPYYNNAILDILEASTVIYLKCNIETLVNRLQGEQELRPLITNIMGRELQTYVGELLYKREPFYRLAHHTIDANQSINKIVEAISYCIKA